MRDEDERAKMAELPRMVEQGGYTEGAVIPVSYAIQDEIVITYDKDHPVMNLGIIYPSMNKFRLALRQFGRIWARHRKVR